MPHTPAFLFPDTTSGHAYGLTTFHKRLSKHKHTCAHKLLPRLLHKSPVEFERGPAHGWRRFPFQTRFLDTDTPRMTACARVWPQFILTPVGEAFQLRAA